MNKYKTIAKNTIYVTIGTIGSKLIFILMLPLYTRWLSASDFGSADTITIYGDVLMTIFFLNISDAIFVCPKNENKKNQISYFSSGLLFILGVCLIYAISLLIIQYFEQYVSSEGIFFRNKWLIYLLVVTRHFQYYTQSFVKSLDKMILYSVSGVILTVMIAFVSLLLVPKFGLDGYVYSIILAQLITTLYTSYKGKLLSFISLEKVRKDKLIELLKYSIPLAPNSIMWWLITGLSRPIMESKLGLVAIGVYAVSNKISGLINTLSGVLGMAWYNSVLDEYRKDGFDNFFNNYIRILTLFYFFFGAFLIIFSRPLVVLFSTPEYYDAYKYVPLLSIGLIFSGVSSGIGGIFSAVKKSKYYFYSSLWGGAVSILSITVLINIWGVIGVSFSFMISFFAILLSRWIYSRRFIVIKNIKYYIILFILLFIIYIIDIYVINYLKYIIDLMIMSGVLFYSRIDIRRIMILLLGKILNRAH